MATTKTAESVSTPTRTQKPRLTAAERRAAEATRRSVEANARAAREAELENHRPLLWLRVWAKALRVELLMSVDSDYTDTNRWWFDDFSVDAVKQSFCIEESGGTGNPLTEAATPVSNFERIEASLDMALQWFDDHLAEKERKRLEELARLERRRLALEKLNDDDKKVLGLR